MEPRLWRCLMHVLPWIRPNGSFMDAGANDGASSVLMARLRHPIIAVEPLKLNLRRIVELTVGLDVRAVHGGLGEAAGTGSYPERLDSGVGRKPGVSSQIGLLKNWQARLKLSAGDASAVYPVYTVDMLMRNQNLSFAHWDVEGGEPALLRGAAATLARDRPLFTVETFPLTNSTRHAELLREVKTAGYRCMEIDEVCGRPKDCRNLMCAPVELHVPACVHSRYISGNHDHGRVTSHERVPAVSVSETQRGSTTDKVTEDLRASIL
jgi:FkbM family methyltransferase